MADFLMERDVYESLLTELLVPDLEQARKTEILQEMRTSHTNAISGASEVMKESEKLQRHNDDLIVSNSMLFRQTGVIGETTKDDKEEAQEFSETVKLADILG